MNDEYETTRFRLRAVTDDDLPALFENFSDPAMMKFYDMEPAGSMADVQALVARWRRREEQGTGVRWAIIEKKNGRFIGTCGLHDINLRTRCAEAGCEVGRRWWGRGVMAEVAPAVGRHAFEVLALDRLHAYIAPANRASLALIGFCGFRRKRWLRDAREVESRSVRPQLYTLTRAAYLRRVQPGKFDLLAAFAFLARDVSLRLAHFLGIPQTPHIR